MDLFGSPTPILDGHLLDEVNCLLGNAWFATLGFRLQLPIAAKEIPMPSQDRLRLDDVESGLPEASQPSRQCQAHPVTFCELRPFHRSFEDDQLLTKDGILDD